MKTGDRIARIVVDVPARALTEPFDYEVPVSLADNLSVGCPVAVPFGGRTCVGYVVGLSRESTYEGSLKPVQAVLGLPLFDEHALSLAAWIASEYLAPLSEALKLFLPPGGAPRAVQSEDGWVLQGRQLAVGAERLVTLVEGTSHTPRANAHVQKAVLDALGAGPLTTAELAAEIPGAAGAIRALENAGVVEIAERERFRRPTSATARAPRHAHTEEQASAVAAIVGMATGSGGVAVLEGVTGSGKTEVYLAAIERLIGAGKTAIVLVPEISLTPQTVGRFRSRLGDAVAVIHSRLSDGERFDQWQLALRGQVKVVVGARSALFAPLADLGLVIIDEEHEPSYKQGQSPRYHAREVAQQLCEARGAALVLGSATPSLEARHRAQGGEYRLLRLTKRVGDARPPAVTIVDMAAEFADGNRSIYSRQLQAQLARVAEAGEKAVLFLNRRGFASFLLCRECGFVPECSSCSVSLTYHEQGDSLQCHHCGATHPTPVTCPRCGSAYLRKFGAGTQRAETELHALFPDLPVVRMDADTTSRKGGHERALLAFESLPSGVLLGTQMIAKGLDYPDVTLVGVLSADMSMHVPDFRAAERTFQLLEQVAGRAGRGTKPGQVVVQTYWADHPAVVAVATGDSEPLYAHEEAERSALGFPPFGRIANLLVHGRSASDVASAAGEWAAAFGQLPQGWELVGPAPAPIARLKGNWRWHLLLKAPLGAPIAARVRDALEASSAPNGVTRIVDIDPTGMV